MSYRDDSILVNGYLVSHSATFTVRSPEFFADVFQKVPTVLELEHYGAVKKQGNWDARPGSNAARHGQGKTGPDYFRGALGLLRATYIGYHGYAHEWLADNRELTGELLNRCGYWYFPHRVVLPAKLLRKENTAMEVFWENRGVAPAYHDYLLGVRLEQDGKRTFEVRLRSGNRRWLPGAREPYRETYLLPLSEGLAPGKHALKIKLWWPEGNRDVLLPLADKLKDKENYYHIGEVEVAAEK
ncbi:hypothetical protein NXS98_12965 [Fontisphaera persica]|uniref:DUF4832 domain-containing protein n=1 Tax=Fontisphaera persica TaxID=2974023 RepID=UPI0024BFE69C|nr:DUF4832 domain-containing protein [Fontisphaera persica]WCJ58625.1 hypothetical protein NXS98_12965 [Fontisphaera persica]